MGGSNPLILREKLEVGSFYLTVWCCAGRGVYGECVAAFPIHFNVGFVHSPVYTSHSASF